MQIGNSPTMISKAQLAELLPRWDRYVRAIHNDTAADTALGWAQEMYGFALALANSPAGVPAVQYKPEWMVQPPFQLQLQVDACQVPRCISCIVVLTAFACCAVCLAACCMAVMSNVRLMMCDVASSLRCMHL